MQAQLGELQAQAMTMSKAIGSMEAAIKAKIAARWPRPAQQSVVHILAPGTFGTCKLREKDL
jgi:hypothetical protein